jgi:CheY-like chemotaxis protein
MEAIGTLAGGIAHEFNNILTTIIGRTEFALDMLPAENPVYQDLQSIRKISGRAANLVSQLLAFARSQVLELTPLNLNTLIENSRETFDRLVGENITIKLALASNLGWVKASPHLLGQVLADLVVNGRDALPMGGVITITTANVTLTYNDIHSPTELKPGEYVSLTVADNGVGISKEVLSHIFEPFFTTKEAGQGVGLGLAACFGIIKQHNGTIQVHSAPNEGATFQIYLPCSSKSDDRPTAPITVSPQGKTILFIEDDPSVRYISTRILNYHGYQVIEATNGLEALDIIQTRKQEIDLLVTDIVLPGMGGLELSDKLKSIQPDIKVLYTSGYAPSHFNQQEQAVIGNTFLQKPYSPHTLAEIVKELLLDD